jgi:hypothetical protein
MDDSPSVKARFLQGRRTIVQKAFVRNDFVQPIRDKLRE